jgi:uncharacterized linocin/CFP29 family protein
MSEKYLHREDTPFGDKVWQEIDRAVALAAKSQLSGRRLLHIQGPFGLGLKSLGSADKPVENKVAEGAKMTAACITPLAFIQDEFALPVRDIAAFESAVSGAAPLDLTSAANAAIACARQEDELIFNGSKALCLSGLLTIEGSLSVKLKPWDKIGSAAEDIIKAVTTLDNAGFHGPYALALAPKLYNLLYRRYPQGHTTELEHIGQIITDGIIKAACISSGGVLLCADSSYASIVLGQDLMTSFIGPSAGRYEFLVSESVALWLTQPQSICILK